MKAHRNLAGGVQVEHAHRQLFAKALVVACALPRAFRISAPLNEGLEVLKRSASTCSFPLLAGHRRFAFFVRSRTNWRCVSKARRPASNARSIDTGTSVS